MTAKTLVGDLGGTNLRLALTDGMALEAEIRFLTAEHEGLESALDAYLDGLPAGHRPSSAILAVAGPVSGDRFTLTNCPWSFSRHAVAERYGWSRFVLLNDFSAVAAGLPYLQKQDLEQIKDGTVLPGAPKLVLGPGTGLGVGVAVPSENGWTMIEGEGGHVSLPAGNAEEADLMQRLGNGDVPVSAEEVLSGSGLVALFNAIAERDGRADRVGAGADVVARLTGDACPVACAVMDRFSSFLAGVAANAALTVGARGGVYLTGGVLAHAGAAFREDLFRDRFTANARMADYLAAIPVYRIRHPEPGLFGLRMLARGVSGA
ncbi:glucokinase [Nisaea sp.]|uniref:glucokinase n=1 Tax=Nisaea sp. TaxID=2024842 RepID=UPI0032EB8303